MLGGGPFLIWNSNGYKDIKPRTVKLCKYNFQIALITTTPIPQTITFKKEKYLKYFR
jgi:hypothetical protein